MSEIDDSAKLLDEQSREDADNKNSIGAESARNLSFSASTIKSWFQYRCDRKTRYESITDRAREHIDIVKELRPQAWADEGNDYEVRVLKTLRQTHRVREPEPGRDSLEEEATKCFLEGRGDYEFAYQANLKAPVELKSYLNYSENITFRKSKPDLIQRVSSNPSVFRVIDIKATQVSRHFHKAQVAFYCLILQALLEKIDPTARVDEVGEIWHFSPGTTGDDCRYEVSSFKTKSYVQLIIDFFRETVPRIERQRLEPGRDETFFHLYFKCEQCDYLTHCTKSIQGEAAQRDVSAVAGLTHEAKHELVRLGARTVGQLAKLNGLRGNPNVRSWNLRRKAEELSFRATAMLEGKASRLIDRYSYLMPPRVDVAFYLLADRDPVSGDLATLGYLLDWQGKTELHTAIIQESNPELEYSALERVMGKLLADMDKVHRHNQASPADQLYAHIFLYEPSEAKDIQEAVGRHLNKPAIRQGLLNLIRLFPPEEIIPEPEYKGVHHLPATALRSVFEQLYALPVLVSYDLHQVSSAIANLDSLTPVYAPVGDFHRPFSSRLAINVMRGLRRGKLTAAVVEADVAARLATLRALGGWLLGQNAAATSPFLRLAKKPFAFQTEFHPLSSGDLDILRAYELLATKSGLLDALSRLAQPWQVRRDGMRCLAQLEKQGTGPKQNFGQELWFFRVPPESRDAELGAEDLDLILTDDDVDIRLNPSRWQSVRVNLNSTHPAQDFSRIGVLVPKKVQNSNDMKDLLSKISGPLWFVDKAYVDYTSDRIISFLADLGEKNTGAD